MSKPIKGFFKVMIKQEQGEPSVKEVSYVGADGKEHTGRQFEGYASTKHPDRTMDIVEPTAFTKTLGVFMENPQLWLQHNPEKTIGSIAEANIDDVGLYVKGIVKVDVDNSFQKLRTGVLKTMSFGYRIREYELMDEDEKSLGLFKVVGSEYEVQDSEGKSYGFGKKGLIKTRQEKKAKYLVIKDLELFEVSLVGVPMNPNAKLKSIDEIPEDVSDAEYKEYFQVDKDDEFPLYKSVELIAKDNEEDKEEEEEEQEQEQEEEKIEEQEEETTDEAGEEEEETKDNEDQEEESTDGDEEDEAKENEQPEDTGGDNASESENDKEKGVSDISGLEKQIATLTAEKTQLEKDLEAKDEVLTDAKGLIDELVKQIDELEKVLEQKQELIDKAKSVREKKGGTFVKKEEDEIMTKLEEIQLRDRKKSLGF